jgi:hypothetical protein
MSMGLALTFLVGIAVGAVVGFLLAPTAYLWVGRREWREASRELELADRLLESLDEPDTSGRSSEEVAADRVPRSPLRHGYGH